MELTIFLAGITVAIVGGFSLALTIQQLKKRLRGLEHNERINQEHTAVQLGELLETAQQRLEQRLTHSTSSAINLATQQAVQQIVSLRETHQFQLQTASQQIEVVKQQAVEEVNHQLTGLLNLKQEVEQLLALCRQQLSETVQQLETQQRVLESPAQQLLNRQEEIDRPEILLSETTCPTFPIETPLEPPPVVEPDFIASLPEIRFETAFVENNVIRREYKTARQLTELLPNNVALELIYIPGGTFIMGSEEVEKAAPPHSVSLKPFLVGKYLITQAQWESVMGNNPSKFRGERLPVETVNWRDAVRFCAKLSQLTGVHYQLLTEARWEYACRAGSMTSYSFGDVVTPELANYEDSGIKQTSEVGIYPANAFGLYDMHGNVWEWCEDTWHENYVNAPDDGTTWDGSDPQIRLLRGGSWYNNTQKLQCSVRIGFDVTSRYDNEGFRVMRLLDI